MECPEGMLSFADVYQFGYGVCLEVNILSVSMWSFYKHVSYILHIYNIYERHIDVFGSTCLFSPLPSTPFDVWNGMWEGLRVRILKSSQKL